MTDDSDIGRWWRGGRWRIVVWGGAALLWCLPLLAMQFTDEVAWDLVDFALFGAMLAAACGTCELAVRTTRNRAYRAAVGVAVATAFLLVWATLAVGFIGDEGHPANAMYGGVLAIGVIAAIIARFRPRGMVYALVATASAQGAAAVIAAIAGWGTVWMPTAGFVALWLISAGLFHGAGKREGTVEGTVRTP